MTDTRTTAPIDEFKLTQRVYAHDTDYPEDGSLEKDVFIGLKPPPGESWIEAEACADCGATVDPAEYHPIEAFNLFRAWRAFEQRMSSDQQKTPPAVLRLLSDL